MEQNQVVWLRRDLLGPTQYQVLNNRESGDAIEAGVLIAVHIYISYVLPLLHANLILIKALPRLFPQPARINHLP